MTDVQLLSSTWDGRTPPPGTGPIALTFVCPDDVVFRLERELGRDLLTLPSADDIEVLNAQACALIRGATAGGPEAVGVHLLDLVLEPLRHIVLRALVARHLADSIDVVGGRPRGGTDLVSRCVHARLGGPVPAPPRELLRRLARRRDLARDRRRSGTGGSVRSSPLPPGGTLAVSSYVNYSRAIGRVVPTGPLSQLLLDRSVEPVRSGPVTYSDTVDAPAVDVREAFGHLRSQLRALDPEISAIIDAAGGLTAIEGSLAQGAAELARTWILLERCQPSLVWVGNQFALDGAVADQARTLGARTAQVLHAFPAAEFRYFPTRTDEVVVPHQRWVDYLAGGGDVRVQPVTPPSAPRDPRSIVLFSTPHHLGDLAAGELAHRDLLGAAVELDRQGWDVVVRAHPAESATTLRRRLAALGGPDVPVDDAATAAPALARAQVAFLAFSTILESCEAMEIPVVARRWFHSSAELHLRSHMPDVRFGSTDLVRDVTVAARSRP